MVLCYSTSVNVSKTVGEIQELLASVGARAILINYSDGMPTALSFKIDTKHGTLAFQLPSRWEGIYKRLQTASRVPKAKKTQEQAQRVAWRIVRQWVQVQMEFVENEVAALEEVFFPYLQSPKDGKTLFETLKKQKFKGLLTEGTA